MKRLLLTLTCVLVTMTLSLDAFAGRWHRNRGCCGQSTYYSDCGGYYGSHYAGSHYMGSRYVGSTYGYSNNCGCNGQAYNHGGYYSAPGNYGYPNYGSNGYGEMRGPNVNSQPRGNNRGFEDINRPQPGDDIPSPPQQ